VVVVGFRELRSCSTPRSTTPLKLYTIYSSPAHKTKREAEAAETAEHHAERDRVERTTR